MSYSDSEKKMLENAKKAGESTYIKIVDFFNDIGFELKKEHRVAIASYIEIYKMSVELYKEDKKNYDERNVNSQEIVNKAKKEIELVYGTVDEYRKHLELFYSKNKNNRIEQQVQIYESTLYFLSNFSNDKKKLKPQKPTKTSLKNTLQNYFKNSIKKELPPKAISNLLASL